MKLSTLVFAVVSAIASVACDQAIHHPQVVTLVYRFDLGPASSVGRIGYTGVSHDLRNVVIIGRQEYTWQGYDYKDSFGSRAYHMQGFPAESYKGRPISIPVPVQFGDRKCVVLIGYADGALDCGDAGQVFLQVSYDRVSESELQVSAKPAVP